eukprot:1024722-Pyramimonas_sp.AAC.1
MGQRWGYLGCLGGACPSPRGFLGALWGSLGAPGPLRGALGAVWETLGLPFAFGPRAPGARA